jgi:hypothetical protein
LLGPHMISVSSFLYIYHFSDAPALSRDSDGQVVAPAVPNVTDTDAPDVNDEGDQWDDEALAATLTRKGAVTASNTKELMDMKASRSEQGDIAEKLRVEETKAKLKAAKEGMEKEAQRLKEAKDKKETGKQEVSSGNPRFGAAAVGLAGGKSWVPPHMRSGGGMMAARLGMGPMISSTKVDTQDENLFPDLKTADTIMEQKKAQQPAFKAPKKTPVGGGATWGSRPKKIAVAPKQVEPPKPVEPEPEPEAQPEEPKPVASAAAPAAAPIKPKKKKKKDLSTFKPSA